MQSFNVLLKLVPVWLLFYFVKCMMENASTCLLLSCNIGNIRDLVSLTVCGYDRTVGFQCNKQLQTNDATTSSKTFRHFTFLGVYTR